MDLEAIQAEALRRTTGLAMALLFAALSGCADPQAEDRSTNEPDAAASIGDAGLDDAGSEVAGDAAEPAPDAGNDAATPPGPPPEERPSVARRWNEAALAAIRRELPMPGVHARNLFHLSVAMYDAWAAFDPIADGYLFREKASAIDVVATRRAAISYAAYRLLRARYASGVGATATLADLDARMGDLGYDVAFEETAGDTGPALGNRIAAAVLGAFADDGSNESGGYADPTYVPVNAPLVVRLEGTVLADPARWQPLAMAVMITQNGIPIPENVQTFVGARWGSVRPFALTRTDPSRPYHDPGPPPVLNGLGDSIARADVVEVIRRQALLDPASDTTIDISPSALGNNSLGADDGTGRTFDPVTLAPYEADVVRLSDYGRVLAEFWADGPHSETPPGHWNVIANQVSDHPAFRRRVFGSGPELDALAWDVTTYLALNGALHDAAIAAWGIKRHYDGIRPISLIRYMAGKGQCTDALLPHYDPDGLPLIPGLIELITSETTAPSGRHENLLGYEGEIAIRAWAGEPGDPTTQVGGITFRVGTTWVPYQKKTFVTPAFPGYVSGHSTFSRAAAVVLTTLTGSEYFPGGLGEFVAPAGRFLTFEAGPTSDVRLQWATYFDAADQAGASRVYGGIHVPSDDYAGRRLGDRVGRDAVGAALSYALGTAVH